MMKKIIISIIVVAVFVAAGLGGYFYFNQNKKEDIEKKINSFITKHQTDPYDIIKSIDTVLPILDAKIKIVDVDNNTIKSLISIKDSDLFDTKKFNIDVPITSVITRGKTKYNNKTYGYGKITTTTDDDFKLTITNNTYIDSDGSMTNVTSVSPITNDVIDVKGLTVISDTSIFDTTNYQFKFKTDGIKLGAEDIVILGPYDYEFSLKNGVCKYEFSPLNISFRYGKKNKNNAIIKLSQGKTDECNYYKDIEGLKTPIYNLIYGYDELSVLVNKNLVKLNNIVIGYGGYINDNKTIDLKTIISSDIDEKSLKENKLFKIIPVTIPLPKRLEFDTSITNIGYDTINTYVDIRNQMFAGKEIKNLDKLLNNIVTDAQKNNSAYNLNINLKTTSGNAKANLKINLSEAGKKENPDELVDAIKSAINKDMSKDKELLLFSSVNLKANITIDKRIVDSLPELQATLMMLGIKAKEKDDIYIIDIEIKDKNIIINGESLM